MFVKHDGQELIHGQHLAQGPGSQESLGPLLGQGITQGPVGVVWVHQVADTLHPALRLLHLQTLTSHIAATQKVKGGGERESLK